MISKYELSQPGLGRMAAIIRGADVPYEDDVPREAAGVAAIFDGLRDADTSDEERLAEGMVICDALYAFCKSVEG